MSDESCFKTCIACGGDGYVPTGGDDYVECPMREEALAYYENLHRKQAALDAVQRTHDDIAKMQDSPEYIASVALKLTIKSLRDALSKADGGEP